MDVLRMDGRMRGRVGKHGSIVRTCGKTWFNCQDVWESMGQLSGRVGKHGSTVSPRLWLWFLMDLSASLQSPPRGQDGGRGGTQVKG